MNLDKAVRRTEPGGVMPVADRWKESTKTYRGPGGLSMQSAAAAAVTPGPLDYGVTRTAFESKLYTTRVRTTFGSGRVDPPAAKVDTPGPGANGVTELPGALQQAGGRFALLGRDSGKKVYTGLPGNTGAVLDTPGPGEYVIPSTIAPSPPRTKHTFGTTARSLVPPSSSAPGPGAYPPLSPTAVQPTLPAPTTAPTSQPPAPASARSSASSVWSTMSGVYVQRKRTKRQQRRDRRWLQQQAERVARNQPKTRVDPDTARLRALLATVPHKDGARTKADPFSTLPTPVVRFEHTFGSTGRDAGACVDPDAPGPAAYPLPADVLGPSTAAAVMRRSSSLPGASFPHADRRKEAAKLYPGSERLVAPDPDKPTPGPAMSPKSTLVKPVNPDGPRHFFGSSSHEDFMRPRDNNPGPQSYVVTSPPRGKGVTIPRTDSNTEVRARYLGAGFEPMPRPDATPGPFTALPTTAFPRKPVAPKPTFGNAQRTTTRPPDTPGPSLPQPSSMRLTRNPHGPEHCFGSGNRSFMRIQDVPGPGQYTRVSQPHHVPGFDFSARADNKSYSGKGFEGSSGGMGPALVLTQDAPSRFGPSRPRGGLISNSKIADLLVPKAALAGPGPGAYGD